MQEEDNNRYLKDSQNEIDLKELFNVLLNRKWIIISVTTFASIVGVVYSLLLPNIYESKALLVPVEPSSSISGALQSYAGLAGLAGISLPTANNEGNSAKAVKKINSLSFFENNILQNIHLPDLMAMKSWDYQSNELIYDESIYQADSNTWLGNASNSKNNIPSAQQSFGVFAGEHLSVIEDTNSRFIYISIKHQSPYIAKQWVELVVDEVNNFYRKKDKSESEKAVNYLNQQIAITDLSEIKEVLAQLLQEETKKLTLIEANKAYVFEYIDPPAVMETRSEPKRSIICIFSAVFGAILGILFVLLRYRFFSEKV